MANGDKPPGNWKQGDPETKHHEPEEKPEQSPETPEQPPAA